VFQSTRQDGRGIYSQAADGSGRAERLTTTEVGVDHIPVAWAPDQHTLLFESVKSARWSLWALSVPGGTTRKLIDEESASAITPVFSPDGRWLAYHTSVFDTTQPRRDTVWLRPFPIAGNRYEVSSEGTSHHPLWINGGRQLIYIVGAGQWMAREVTFGAAPVFALPRTLPSLIVPTSAPGGVEARTFDLMRDGRIVADSGAVFGAGGQVALTPSIEVVEHWFEELKAKGIGVRE
jgi:dipeptidyl aminopeptidase/acylaminoacyl peptidase